MIRRYGFPVLVMLAAIIASGMFIVDRVTEYAALHCAREHAITDGDIVNCYTSRGLPAPADLVTP